MRIDVVIGIHLMVQDLQNAENKILNVRYKHQQLIQLDS